MDDTLHTRRVIVLYVSILRGGTTPGLTLKDWDLAYAPTSQSPLYICSCASNEASRQAGRQVGTQVAR